MPGTGSEPSPALSYPAPEPCVRDPQNNFVLRENELLFFYIFLYFYEYFEYIVSILKYDVCLFLSFFFFELADDLQPGGYEYNFF